VEDDTTCGVFKVGWVFHLGSAYNLVRGGIAPSAIDRIKAGEKGVGASTQALATTSRGDIKNSIHGSKHENNGRERLVTSPFQSLLDAGLPVTDEGGGG